MRKKILRLLSVVLASSILLANVVCVNAASMYYESDDVDVRVVPCLDSGITYNCSFAISTSGKGSVKVWYSAESSEFKQVKLVVKLQKQVLGLFWKTVDIGEVDNQWTVYSSNANDLLYYYVNIEETGTYRAIISLEIMNTSDNVDKIEKTIECEYN